MAPFIVWLAVLILLWGGFAYHIGCLTARMDRFMDARKWVSYNDSKIKLTYFTETPVLWIFAFFWPVTLAVVVLYAPFKALHWLGLKIGCGK